MKRSWLIGLAVPVLALTLGTASVGEAPTSQSDSIDQLHALVSSGLIGWHTRLNNPNANSLQFEPQYQHFFPNYPFTPLINLKPVLDCRLQTDPINEPATAGINRQTLLMNVFCGTKLRSSFLGFVPQEYLPGLTIDSANYFLEVINQNDRRIVQYPSDKVFTTNCVSFVLSQLYGKDFSGYWIASETTYDLFYKSGLFEKTPILSISKNKVSNANIDYSEIREGDVMVWYDLPESTNEFKAITHVGIIRWDNESNKFIVYNKYGQLPVITGNITEVTESLETTENNLVGLDILRPTR